VRQATKNDIRDAVAFLVALLVVAGALGWLSP
jgi:hypothetical protein